MNRLIECCWIFFLLLSNCSFDIVMATERNILKIDIDIYRCVCWIKVMRVNILNLIPGLRGNAFSFLPLCLLPVGLSYGPLICWSRLPLCLLSGKNFIMNVYWTLLEVFSAWSEMIMHVLFFTLLMWYITLSWRYWKILALIRFWILSYATGKFTVQHWQIN